MKLENDSEVLNLPEGERERIINFIHHCANGGENILILVSGGLDSDVVARLCAEAVGRERIKLLLVVQDDMEEKFISNARRLAADLHVRLSSADLRQMNSALIKAAEEADPDLFDSNSLLDPMRAKCSMRSALICSYQDKGYLIVGASNRTETELGFFLPFGDNLSHFKPIAHLYKTQVRQLAVEIGCESEVLNQPPSAGFWEGQDDLEDLAYWMINGGPIMGRGRVFTDAEVAVAEEIRSKLSQTAVDKALLAIASGFDPKETSRISQLPHQYTDALRKIVINSRVWKNRPLLTGLPVSDWHGGIFNAH